MARIVSLPVYTRVRHRRAWLCQTVVEGRRRATFATWRVPRQAFASRDAARPRNSSVPWQARHIVPVSWLGAGLHVRPFKTSDSQRCAGSSYAVARARGSHVKVLWCAPVNEDVQVLNSSLLSSFSFRVDSKGRRGRPIPTAGAPGLWRLGDQALRAKARAQDPRLCFTPSNALAR